MKPEWKETLIDSGAEFAPDRDYEVTSFGNTVRERRATMGGTVICDLSHLGLLQAYGEETADFLQGQLTNDINEISDSHSQLTAFCNPKGRALATFRAFQRDNTTYLTVACDLLETTLKRLHMFIMRSKVTIEDGNDALVRFGISGSTAEEELNKALGGHPAEVNDVQRLRGVTAIRVPGAPHPRFELYGELNEMEALWTTLNVHCAPVGADSWRLLDILAGLPTVSMGTREAYVPQMINYDLIGGISFKKGCYTGQEVIARMHYLGAPKRRMYRIHFDTDEIPAPGLKLFTSGDDNEQSIGSIVMAAAHPDGGVETLAVILIKYASGDKPVLLGSTDGLAGKINLPPYDIPAPADKP